MNRSSRLFPTAILMGVFFLSGVAALIYEVLWLKELGRLFGVTAYATSATLAVFFVGLAMGGLVWGRRSAVQRNPLRVYALLEFAIAGSALLYFFVLDFYRGIYGPIFRVLGDQPAVFVGVKLALAVGILFLPAFFMGGTLPLMGQFMIRESRQLGSKTTLLYFVNTLGAAVGAFLAGFYLPPTLGFTKSYTLAISMNVAIGVVTLFYSSKCAEPEPTTLVAETGPTPGPDDAEIAGPAKILLVAAISGFATLGLEVLWVRMFAQVLQNSVYTFSAVLTVFLISLALGSALANLFCRRPWQPSFVLFVLLTLSGLLAGATPALFYWLTSGLEPVARSAGWTDYVRQVFLLAFVVIALPGVVMGSVFPYLLKLAEGWAVSAGKTIGQLASINTGASILGSIAAGFLMLDLFGLWTSIWAMAILYLGVAVLLPSGQGGGRWKLKSVPILGILVVAGVSARSGLAVVFVDSQKDEEVVEVWEGSQGTVAVVSQAGNLRLKLDNSYTLGGSDSAALHRRQAWLPLAVHPDPKSVFFLGMGTGISAGAALDLPVNQVTVTELSPDIIVASRTHFGPWVGRLFEDPRVRVIMEDGRNYLFGSDERFDVIIADLFLSWKAGVGDLYAKEHFETVRDRLSPDGLFAQWLPLAQLTEREFRVIARTMLEVFPQVSVWRRGYSMPTPAVALIGFRRAAPLANGSFLSKIYALGRIGEFSNAGWIEEIPHALYAGDLSALEPSLADVPLNTDDLPLIEYLAPISNRQSTSTRQGALTGLELYRFFDKLLQMAPPSRDPFLAQLDPEEIDSILAGLELFAITYYRNSRSPLTAQAHFERLKQLKPHLNLD